MFGRVHSRRPTEEELRQEAALVLAARIGAGRPPFEPPRRSRPQWAGAEPTASWYHPAEPALSGSPVEPLEVPSTGPLLLRTVHLPGNL